MIRRPAYFSGREAKEPPTAWWRPELNDDSIPALIDAPPDGARIHGPLGDLGMGEISGGTSMCAWRSDRTI